jgi:hypothetical protein
MIESAVQYAESMGLVVVINDQTERGGASDTTDNEPLPTIASEAFWHRIDEVYARDPQVVYDIFNEPRPVATPGMTERALWDEWLNGGTYTYTYRGTPITIHGIGEQALADFIRRDGAANLIWVEGLLNLDYVARYPDTYLLKGDGPIVYTYHHTANGLPHDASTWDAQFGSLVRNDVAPVVDGEWTNYATDAGRRYRNGDIGECWADAPNTVPVYLAYLRRLGIGMTVWTLAAGFMNSTPGNYVSPTRFGSDWACMRGLDQGAGQVVQNWYFQNNSVPTPVQGRPPILPPPRGSNPANAAPPISSGSTTGATNHRGAGSTHRSRRCNASRPRNRKRRRATRPGRGGPRGCVRWAHCGHACTPRSQRH